MGAIHKCIDPTDSFVGIGEDDISPESARSLTDLMARVRLACDALEARITPGPPDGETDPTPRSRATDSRLSQREREVAQLLFEGCTSVNIAARLGVSTNTVRTLMRRIYRKLGVCNRADLVREVMRAPRRPGDV